ncbi:MAG TPA: hypothetical protein VMB71_11225 [Acetobacteraceae bacterium]|nr:hypothetical protein [Acetobacteraceae bacterium]
MDAQTGRCSNKLFCAAAGAGAILTVPQGARFVCRQCGKPLTAVVDGADGKRGSMGLVIGSVMTLVGGGVCAAGMLWGGGPAAQAQSAPYVAATAPAASPSIVAAPRPSRHHTHAGASSRRAVSGGGVNAGSGRGANGTQG